MYYDNQSFDDQSQSFFGRGSHACGGRFGRHFAQKFARNFSGSTPVNILEATDRFELHVVAPGLSKEDFKLSVSDEVLVIAYQGQSSKSGGIGGNWVRQEYQSPAFERRFALSDRVDSTGIQAKYTDGILIVTLPKKVPGTPPQDINIA
jgi:HSP20 family protein